jgi:hypothetical protein
MKIFLSFPSSLAAPQSKLSCPCQSPSGHPSAASTSINRFLEDGGKLQAAIYQLSNHPHPNNFILMRQDIKHGRDIGWSGGAQMSFWNQNAHAESWNITGR